jgi:hypothetical protein
MWIMLSDAFFSIVRKDVSPGQLLVRARRPGDIEKVFGRHVRVDCDDRGDYLYRARIARSDVAEVLERELSRIDYGNFKDSVQDDALHHAYMDTWTAMARVQPTPPYAGSRRQLAAAGTGPQPAVAGSKQRAKQGRRIPRSVQLRKKEAE